MYFCVSCHPAPLLLCTNATLCNTATAGDAGLPVSHDPSPTAPPRPRAGSALSPRIMLGVLEVSMVQGDKVRGVQQCGERTVWGDGELSNDHWPGHHDDHAASQCRPGPGPAGGPP